MATAKCIVDGCDAPKLARDKCRKHYRQEVPDKPRRRVEPKITSECITCRSKFQHTRKARSGECPACANTSRRMALHTKWPTCRIHVGTCARCGRLFTSRRARRFCTGQCAYESRLEGMRKTTTCRSCGMDKVADGKLFCIACRSERHRANRRRNKTGNHRHRARQYGVPYEPIAPRKIYERDHYVCYLCGQLTNPMAPWLDDRYPSLDHVIPMSKGGGHILTNVRCACRGCNSRKGDLILT